MKRILFLLSILPALFLQTAYAEGITGRQVKQYVRDLPFVMKAPKLPEIPKYTVSLADFGAKGDGVTLCTDAFEAAMRHLASKGGGHLVVPSGIWFTGPIELLSNIDLHLEANAVILFSSDKTLYPIISTSFEGLDCRRCESPIHAQGARNISITGSGTIDGGGDAWRAVKKSKLTSAQWKARVASGGVLNEKKDVWYPDEAFIKGERLSDKGLNVPYGLETDEDWESVRSFLRPVMVSLRYCDNVLLEGCTFQNSPCWHIHPLMCKDLVVNDITVRCPSWSQNGDGIDIESCENTLLVNSSFDVGDDGICVKSGKDADGRRRGVPTRNLVVDNCTVYHGHGGFVVGSEMSGGVENVKVSNCRFLGTDVGLRFKSKRGRGGVVKGIWINDIYMTDIKTETLLFDLFYGGMSAVEAAEKAKADAAAGIVAPPDPVYEVDETTPQFRDIRIKDVVCNGAARAMYFNGLAEMPVENVTIEDCVVKSVEGIIISRSKDVTIRNVTIHNSDGKEPVIVLNSENINTELR
jgi:Endopolygalacturonase